MTVKEIIGTCLEKTGAENFVNKTALSVQQERLIEKLLVALNTAYLGGACDVLEQVAKEDVVVENGEIYPTALSKTIVHPISLRDDKGVKHSYSIYPDRITTDFSGNAVLEYAYLPAKLTIDDEINDIRMTADMLSDGALSEYYFTLRVFDLASSYEEQFRTKLSKAKYKGREIILKARRWGD